MDGKVCEFDGRLKLLCNTLVVHSGDINSGDIYICISMLSLFRVTNSFRRARILDWEDVC